MKRSFLIRVDEDVLNRWRVAAHRTGARSLNAWIVAGANAAATASAGGRNEMISVNIGASQERKPLENLLNDFGRIGGPTEYGWHTFEPSFRCWREAYFTNTKTEANHNPNSSFALAVGTIVHEFLAAYYTTFMPEKTFTPNGEKSPEALYTMLCTNGYADEANEAKRLFDAYLKKYDGKDSYLAEGVKIIAIEHHVKRTFPWGDPYTARADMVLKMPDGYWLVDHKTTAARTTEFVEGWQAEPGIIGLMWACQEEFKPLRGVSINGIVKTKVPDFDRFMYALDERMVSGFLDMMRFHSAEKAVARLAGYPPNFSACFRKMGSHVGKCRFFSRCVYGMEQNGC
jgi:hypothetical protein